MKPGEIYNADLREVGRHRVIVISREELNRGEYVVAVVCTSAKFRTRSTLPNSVPFRAGEFGFTKDCVAQGESVQQVERRFLDAEPIDALDEERLRDVIRAVGYVMDADCEPA